VQDVHHLLAAATNSAPGCGQLCDSHRWPVRRAHARAVGTTAIHIECTCRQGRWPARTRLLHSFHRPYDDDLL